LGEHRESVEQLLEQMASLLSTASDAYDQGRLDADELRLILTEMLAVLGELMEILITEEG